MQWLAALCVKRPVFATVLILSLTVVGLFAFTLLGVDQFPKIDFPRVIVTTIQPGAAPEQIETEISDKIEEAVNTISGIDELRSISVEGVSQVFVTFAIEKNVEVAAQDVRDHVSLLIPQLPKGTDPPVVQKFDPDAVPILYIAVHSSKPSFRTSTSASAPACSRPRASTWVIDPQWSFPRVPSASMARSAEPISWSATPSRSAC